MDAYTCGKALGNFGRRVMGMMVLVAPAAKVVAENLETKGSTDMTWLSTLLNLIPVIVQGVQVVHADKSLGDKTKLAADSLNLAIAGAQATAPESEKATVAAVGAVAQTALQGTVTALHNASQPATATA